jgi:hypothetical protein
MITTVQNVRGQNPEEWLANPKNVYCGRWQRLRTGRYAGQHWPESGLGNPFKFMELDRPDERRYKLFSFLKWLATELETNIERRNIFRTLPGKNLGCWCVNWDGLKQLPMCHAAWLANVVNLLADVRVLSVAVSEKGSFAALRRGDRPQLLRSHTYEWVLFDQKWLV